MAIFRDINVNQTGGRGRSGLWTVLRRTDRTKLFSLTFDRGLNLREMELEIFHILDFKLAVILRKKLKIPKSFLYRLRPSLLMGKFCFFEKLTLIGKSRKTHPEFLLENSSIFSKFQLGA